MNTKAVLIGLLLAGAAILGSACQPHEIAAVQAIARDRESVRLNGFLTCVRYHESDRGGYPHTNGYHIYNSHGQSTSSGAYQFVVGTWRSVSTRAGHPGYARAMDAPAWVQDAVAYDVAIRRGERYHWKGAGC